MLRFLAGVGSTLLLVAAGFFFWKSQAEREQIVPPAPAGAALMTPLKAAPLPTPPEASEKSREEKRFARADKDDDGRIARAEMLEPRRKAFAKLDGDGNGTLSFEEWAVKTVDKFASADADRSGWLSAEEYAATKPRQRARPKCSC